LENYIEKRPWGKFEILLDSSVCKVKKITVNPFGKLSYQYHSMRSEHWTIVSGTGEICINGKVSLVGPGDGINIPALIKHSIRNPYEIKLEFIEVQTGKYFGEDDIVRLEDKYGRI